MFIKALSLAGLFYTQTSNIVKKRERTQTHSYLAEQENLGHRNSLPLCAIYFIPCYYQRHFLSNLVV